MNQSVYTEYLLNGEHRITIGMPGPGKCMVLTWSNTGDALKFRNRKACLKWLLASCPEAQIYAFNEGVTVCGGSVRGLAERAGIKAKGEA
jgi:hypothetical protein